MRKIFNDHFLKRGGVKAMRKSRRFSYCSLLFVVATMTLSCQRELDFQPVPGQDVSMSLTGEIVFSVADANAELLTKSSPAEEKPTISYGMIRPSNGEGHHIANITMMSEPLELPAWGNDTQTKADVTGLSSFYVTCVTGSAGSESQSWGNVGFSGSSTFSGGKYWPSSNLGYKFYASNASMSFASGGTTVSASNSTDVVVAYKTDATYYASSNSLSFSHIFGKVGSVTVSPADGFDSSDITDVSITIVPKTGGTYNIRTGSWSSVSTGSATAIANSTPGTKNNGLYLVPDTYTITASWNAKGKDFEGSGDFSVSAGECKNFTITVGGSIDILPGAFSIANGEQVYFTRGNLQAVISDNYSTYSYHASEWKFAENQWDVIGNNPGNNQLKSGGSFTGTTVDTFIWVGTSATVDNYGLSRYTSNYSTQTGNQSTDKLKTAWENIPYIQDNLWPYYYTLSYTNWDYLLNTRTNAASLKGYGIVNGINGLILLPDSWVKPANCTFTAAFTSAAQTSNTYTNGGKGTANAWCDMEAAGAVFLPREGYRSGATMNSTTYGYYQTSTPYSTSYAYKLRFATGSSPLLTYENRYYGSCVRLVSKYPSSFITFSSWKECLFLSEQYDPGFVSSGSGTPSFYSSNPSVATINSSGLITALSVGQTNITVSLGNKSETKTLKVKSPYLPGAFSIASGVKCHFSAGNLKARISALNGRYATPTDFTFHSEQYHYLGGVEGNISYPVDSWADLFGWVGQASEGVPSASSQPIASINSYGLIASDEWGYSENYQYGGYKTDVSPFWGNKILFDDEYGQPKFTVLTKEQAQYLINRSDQLFLGGTITYGAKQVHGIIILPDNWTKPSNCSYTPGEQPDYKFLQNNNIFSADARTGESNAWCDMEAAGAVFLPATGYYNHGGNKYNNENEFANYWTSSSSSSDWNRAAVISVYANGSCWLRMYDTGYDASYRSKKQPVRLVAIYN